MSKNTIVSFAESLLDDGHKKEGIRFWDSSKSSTPSAPGSHHGSADAIRVLRGVISCLATFCCSMNGSKKTKVEIVAWSSAMGMYLIRNGSPEQSEALIREALESAPNEMTYLVLLAKALAVQAGENGKSDKAMECVELLKRVRFPDNPIYVSHGHQ